MAERPIFVVGYPRSGTTLLQSLLGAHPRIAATPEIHYWMRIVDLADYWGDLADDTNAERAIREVINAPLGMLDEAGFDEVSLLSSFQATDRSYAALLATVMADFADRHAKARWSEKSPLQRPSQIWELLPDAQVVHIVRDPRDVAASESASFDRMPAWRSAQRCCHFTRRSIEDAAHNPTGSYLRLRYEDLATNPQREMDAVFNFLGEEHPPHLLHDSRSGTTAVPSKTTPWQHEATEPVRPPVSSWQRTLGPRERALVAAICADVVHDLGYPPAASHLVALGRALGPTTWPTMRRERLAKAAHARTALTPADRHAAVQSLIADESRRWSS